MPRNTPVGNCKSSPAFLVAVFATAFLVSPRKYQLKIIHILPLVGRKHERHVQSTENLKQHAPPPEKLQVGDNIFIQNQTENNPTRWDYSGDFVETRDFDQYLEKASRSGRLTLRNWLFLRKLETNQLYSNQKSDLGNQFLFADVSTSSIPPVTHGSVPAANSSLEPAALPQVNQSNSGNFDQPSVELSVAPTITCHWGCDT